MLVLPRSVFQDRKPRSKREIAVQLAWKTECKKYDFGTLAKNKSPYVNNTMQERATGVSRVLQTTTEGKWDERAEKTRTSLVLQSSK